MLFAYLDEFGHVGPFVHRKDPLYRDSPVFGMAGIVLPEAAIRPFATKFLKLKEHAFEADIIRARKAGYNWEKKGSEIFRPKALEKYPAIREIGFRLLSELRDRGGKVFYHGREKMIGTTEVNPIGLYTTVFSATIRSLDKYANSVGSNFALVVDEHSSRKELLECAAKTMYGSRPTRKLVSPPFEVESYLNQNMQAADWIAAIVGRLGSYQILPDQFSDHEIAHRLFNDRIHAVATHSTIVERRVRPTVVEVSDPSHSPLPQQTLRYSVLDLQRKYSKGQG